MKMSLQLFTFQNQCVLDFRNLPTSESERLRSLDLTDRSQRDLSGLHTMEFFELCGLVIAELGK